MSYILDALRKSETERRQGKVPDLGQQVQLIHRPKKKRVSPVVWVALALMVNAVVLAVVFWPEKTIIILPEPSVQAPVQDVKKQPEPVQNTAPVTASETAVTDPAVVPETRPASAVPLAEPKSKPEPEPVNKPVAEPTREWPAIITPSVRQQRQPQVVSPSEPKARVPHLVELPLSFQKSIPDLMFNSHIYSTDPYASRVMINGHYLGQGDSFSGITVEEVTENGVVLSKQGRSFHVGIVRDWVSPR